MGLKTGQQVQALRLRLATASAATSDVKAEVYATDRRFLNNCYE